jgi:hypothetical protein
MTTPSSLRLIGETIFIYLACFLFYLFSFWNIAAQSSKLIHCVSRRLSMARIVVGRFTSKRDLWYVAQKRVPNVDILVNSFVDDMDHGSAVYLQPSGVNRPPAPPQEVAAGCSVHSWNTRGTPMQMLFKMVAYILNRTCIMVLHLCCTEISAG